jgi:hypothetical protein
LDSIRSDQRTLAGSTTNVDLHAKLRGLGIVVCAAAVEAFVHGLSQALWTQIDLVGAAPFMDLKPALLVAPLSPLFESAESLSGLRKFNRRMDLLENARSLAPASLSGHELPFRSQTIRTAHIEYVWRIFAFPLPIWPSQRHRLALETVADQRNIIAHGEDDAVAVGRRYPDPDFLRLIDSCEGIVSHCYMAAEACLTNATFVR